MMRRDQRHGRCTQKSKERGSPPSEGGWRVHCSSFAWHWQRCKLRARIRQRPKTIVRRRAASPLRMDRYGDPLPEGAHVFRTSARHACGTKPSSSPPSRMYCSATDGKFVYSSGRFENRICMWETARGRCVRRFPAHVNLPGGAIALSVDGSLLAVGDVYEMHLYDTATGKEQQTLEFPRGKFVFPARITLSPHRQNPDDTSLGIATGRQCRLPLGGRDGEAARELENWRGCPGRSYRGRPARGLDRGKRSNDRSLGSGQRQKGSRVENGEDGPLERGVPDFLSRRPEHRGRRSGRHDSRL